MKIQGNSLSMVRGDSESIVVSFEDSNGLSIPLVTGDIIYFTVKPSVNTSIKSFQKVVTTFVDGKAVIEILPVDTKTLRFGIYVYDIQLSRSDETVRTIIPASKFKLSAEVTDE